MDTEKESKQMSIQEKIQEQQIKLKDDAKPAPRIAYVADPLLNKNTADGYDTKYQLLPDYILKQTRIRNLVVANIMRARGNAMSSFGYPRKDNRDVGFEVKIQEDLEKYVPSEDMAVINDRISRIVKLLIHCGNTKGLTDQERMTFTTFLKLITENALTFGRFAVELIKDETNEKMHHFRPVDVSTIYPISRDANNKAFINVRESGARELETVKGDEIDLETLKTNEKFVYVQIINGIKRMAFTSEELIVYNVYPTTDVENSQYSITPIDTAINSVTTYLDIETYNKLYFQNGRAAKGVLVIKSDAVDQKRLDDINQAFTASINNVQNSFRTPLIGLGNEDDVNWLSTTQGSRDGEFQYLYDSVIRNVLSAFSISPDEIPGYSHLSRGTNQQGLCLDLSTEIYSKDGKITLEQAIGDKQETEMEVWTGKKFEKAKVFKTGKKQQQKTIFNNKTEIITSSDHRFLCLNPETAQKEWKKQSELQIGDIVFSNKKNVENNDIRHEFNGKLFESDIYEALGWFIGDGCLSKRINTKTGNFKGYHGLFFYHHNKEQDILQKHFETLKKYGVNCKIDIKNLTEKQINVRKNGIGSQNVSSVLTRISVFDSSFFKYIISLGFDTSKNGKKIPSSFFCMKEEFKAAFLRGFFSADGGLDNTLKIQAKITIANNTLRRQTKDLLLSMGIRTHNSETGGTSLGKTREYTKKDCILAIKDTHKFFDKIGFLQDHKQPDWEKLKSCIKKKNEISKQVVEHFVNAILCLGQKAKEVLGEQIYFNLHACLNPKIKRGLSPNMLFKYMNLLGMPIPEWHVDYNVLIVSEKIDVNQTVEMADVEIFDNFHAFVANNLIVHNSESNNEYKLLAARDTGFRPLMLQVQDFINHFILKRLDPELSQLCYISFAGLDTRSREQELTVLQQEMPISMNYNDVMSEMKKDSLPQYLSATVPFNQQYQQISGFMNSLGEIQAHFFDDAICNIDPLLAYKRDPFFFQWLQLVAQSNPEIMQAFIAYYKKGNKELIQMLIEDNIHEEE